MAEWLVLKTNTDQAKTELFQFAKVGIRLTDRWAYLVVSSNILLEKLVKPEDPYEVQKMFHFLKNLNCDIMYLTEMKKE